MKRKLLGSLSVYLSFIAMEATVLAVETTPPPVSSPPVEEELSLKDVLFDPNKYDIRPDAEPLLRENAETLKEFPDTALIIEGYTDTRGGDEYNLRLALARGSAVKAYLVRLGIDPKRIEVVAEGATSKFSSGSTEKALQLNRRAHLVVEPKALKPTASISSTTPPTQGSPQDLAHPAELSKIIEDELKKLAPKRILFNPPREMRVGVSERVDVRISETIIEDLYSAIKERNVPQVDGIKLGQSMTIELSGYNFDIKSLNHEEDLSKEGKFIRWDWDVTPLESGTQSLLLTATVRTDIPNHGEEGKKYPLYVKPIKVKISPIYSSTSFIKSHWKWIVGVAIAFAIIRWTARGKDGVRKKRSKRV